MQREQNHLVTSYGSYFYGGGDPMLEETILGRLVAGYNEHYLSHEKEEQMLGILDESGRAVAMSIRLHLFQTDGQATLKHPVSDILPIGGADRFLGHYQPSLPQGGLLLF